MSRENLDHVVSGAIFDFMGWLTTRTERLTLSSADDAVPAADAIKEFLTLRGVDLSCEPMIFLWPERCNNGKCAAPTTTPFRLGTKPNKDIKDFFNK